MPLRAHTHVILILRLTIPSFPIRFLHLRTSIRNQVGTIMGTARLQAQNRFDPTEQGSSGTEAPLPKWKGASCTTAPSVTPPSRDHGTYLVHAIAGFDIFEDHNNSDSELEDVRIRGDGVGAEGLDLLACQRLVPVKPLGHTRAFAWYCK